jgi:hypothetical protein
MMDSMNASMGGMPYMAPLWLIYSLCALFFAGALFYYYRLVKPDSIKAVYGYYDWQNEVAHGLCLLAMASALAATPLWQMPAPFWASILSLAALFFLVRACTFGRKLPYNKWWWDWSHVAMLGAMAMMFLPIDTGLFSYALEAFWLWFAGYYVWSLVHDLLEPKVYYIGSDLLHLAMGIVMFIMTAFPMVLMAPGASMPGMNMSICHGMSGMDNMSHMNMPSTPTSSAHQN